MHTTLIALTTAAAGYTLGRFRPWNRMEDWVGRQVYKTWWIGSAPKEVLLFALLVVFHPRFAAEVWADWRDRKRNKRKRNKKDNDHRGQN